MLKWFKIKRFLRKMRKEKKRYDFVLLTKEDEIIIYVKGEEEELRIKW